MTQAAIDLIDRAFIGRFQGEAVEGEAVEPLMSRPCAGEPLGDEESNDRPASNALTAALVPAAWAAIASELEAATAAGCRVIAVVAVRRGDGCSTVAQGAVRALVARGRRAACVTKPPLQLASRDAEVDRADIVVVDAGTWFPPGPIRRHHVARQAFGCDAVILVRRADRPRCEPHAEALAAIGLCVLGEVETFADDAADASWERHDA
jgi:hypothetical protein